MRSAAIWLNADASVSKSGRISDGVLSANCFSSAASFATSPFAPWKALANAVPRFSSDWQFADEPSAPSPEGVVAAVVVVAAAVVVVVAAASVVVVVVVVVALFFDPQPGGGEDENEQERESKDLGGPPTHLPTPSAVCLPVSEPNGFYQTRAGESRMRATEGSALSGMRRAARRLRRCPARA